MVASKGGRRGTLSSGGKEIVSVPLKLRVHFAKVQGFKKQLHEHRALKGIEMEKYGVDETVNQERLEKQAAEGCPECGKELVKHGSVLLCPTHGSEPFESMQQNDGNREKSSG